MAHGGPIHSENLVVNGDAERNVSTKFLHFLNIKFVVFKWL